MLAKLWAVSDMSDEQLVELARHGTSSQTRLAAAIAYGIRVVDQASINAANGNVVIGNLDLIVETTKATGTALATTYGFAIAQAWAGQAMDTTGHCILADGLSDCIITR